MLDQLNVLSIVCYHAKFVIFSLAVISTQHSNSE